MMTRSNPTHALLFRLLILSSIFSSFLSSHPIKNTTTIFCPDLEKQSLLSFKQSLEDPRNLLFSWDGEVNCCKWEGVTCNNFTGHVHELRLGPFHSEGLKGNINPSLLNLKYLRYLDLSNNILFGETIPSFIGLFANLEHLDLSGTGFFGKVPHTVGNLSNLRTLNLGAIQDDRVRTDFGSPLGVRSNLVVDSLEWLSRLSQIKYLNMDGVDLSKVSNWVQVISSLPSLIELHFENCNLDFMHDDDPNTTSSLEHLYLSRNPSVTLPQWIFQLTSLVSLDLRYNGFMRPIPTVSNATKIQHIDLSRNQLNSSIPDWLYFCRDLKLVDLSWNKLNGTISTSVANLTSLNSLVLPYNQLSGKIPKEIANLCNIQMLYLTFNDFQGDISDSFGNMSGCFLESLTNLLLWGNKLSGHLTNQFGEFKGLQFLDLGNNLLSGEFPTSILKLSSLKWLSLAGNKFTGTLPEGLGQLFNLQNLRISGNMLEGVVTETHFANLTKLKDIYAYGNNLTLKVSPTWNPPFQLVALRIGWWNVGSEIPAWLETQKSIEYLDLSNTRLSGNIPSWVWKIRILALSSNHLSGKIPKILGQTKGQYIFLASNRFNGSLPRVAATVRALDLSNNSFSGGISDLLCDATHEAYALGILHLGGNQLSGEVPDCWIKWPSLNYLNLGSNNISGSIPSSLGHLASLRSLNLHGNKLSGEIPFLMQKCKELVMMDLGDNYLEGDIPTWVGTSLFQLTYLILRSNNLSGEIPSEICHLISVQILDLSDNKLSGVIPRCLYNFTAMAITKSTVGRYSYSNYGETIIESASVIIKGRELEYGPTLDLVTNINFSKNKLTGDIPKELTSLVELRSLNLSQNLLTGSILEKIGDMKQLESLDLSMNSLSGRIPDGFTLLSFLNYLNLSCNKLTGEIPKSAQLQSLDASSFIGNSLCGLPLKAKCYRHDDNDPNEDDESGIKWFYVILSFGYAVGFSAVCAALVLNKSWRDDYFGFVEFIWNTVYVYVCIKHRKLSGLRS